MPRLVLWTLFFLAPTVYGQFNLQAWRGRLIPGFVSSLDATLTLYDADNNTALRTILDGDVVTLNSPVPRNLRLDVQVQEERILPSNVKFTYAFEDEDAVPLSSALMLASILSDTSETNLTRIGNHQVTVKAKYFWGLGTEQMTVNWWVVVRRDETTPTVNGTSTNSSDSSNNTSTSNDTVTVDSFVPVMAVKNRTMAAPQGVTIHGEGRTWHKMTLAFTGPWTSETATPNPFTDYRLDVVFTHTSGHPANTTAPPTLTRLVVPGYYAADGRAADTSAQSGAIWHCHFAPPRTGVWTWRASFWTGPEVALLDAAVLDGWNFGRGNDTMRTTAFHGINGSLLILPTNKTGVDLRAKGLLRAVPGKHHYQFAETGEWFLKVGTDSPENFLAYDDFDNTPNYRNFRKSWRWHVRDYRPGDPTWKKGQGKGIIGALNYLSHQGMRAFSFLTMNLQGDDRNVFPFRSPSSQSRMDVSKLAQWEIVFEHADRRGLFMHVKTQEQESDQILDNGDLGYERKLYYRELVARFSHHLALNWNLGEENTNTGEQRKQYADWIRALDPYQHPIVVHTFIADHSSVYESLYGHPTMDGASIQTLARDVFVDTLIRVRESAAAGRPWVVTNDEQGNAENGVKPDRVDESDHYYIRSQALWGNIMAGGAGVELYFGYAYANSDLTCQNFRSRARMWAQSRYAVNFFVNNAIAFENMTNANQRLLSNIVSDDDNDDDAVGASDVNWCLAGSKDVVVYLPFGDTDEVDMSGLVGAATTSTVSILWYNPRQGGILQNGTITSVQVTFSTSYIPLGDAPHSLDDDWVVLLRRRDV